MKGGGDLKKAKFPQLWQDSKWHDLTLESWRDIPEI